MTWENCLIKLNSDSTESFYCGDVVTGIVVLKFKQKQKIERIEISICGTSKASWTRPSPTIPHIKFYSQKKRVLHISIDLFDNIQGKTVTPGEYEYPFHFALPHDLPSSFESSIARIYYCVKIKLSGPCKIKKIQPFKVLGNVNLNHIAKYLKLKYTVSEGYADEEKRMCKVSKKDFQSLHKETCCLSLDIPHIVPSSINTQESQWLLYHIF